jgi:hypothetical protein
VLLTEQAAAAGGQIQAACNAATIQGGTWGARCSPNGVYTWAKFQQLATMGAGRPPCFPRSGLSECKLDEAFTSCALPTAGEPTASAVGGVGPGVAAAAGAESLAGAASGRRVGDRISSSAVEVRTARRPAAGRAREHLGLREYATTDPRYPWIHLMNMQWASAARHTAASRLEKGALVDPRAAVNEQRAAIVGFTAAVDQQRDAVEDLRAAVNRHEGALVEPTAAVGLQKGALVEARAAVNLQKDALVDFTGAVNEDRDALVELTAAVSRDRAAVIKLTAALGLQKGAFVKLTAAVSRQSDALIRLTAAVTRRSAAEGVRMGTDRVGWSGHVDFE